MKASSFNRLLRARWLQYSLVVMSLSAAGCVIPLNLEPEPATDAGGIPAAPSILSGDPPFGQVITLTRMEKRAVSAIVEDANPTDTIDARLFLDPTNITPPQAIALSVDRLPPGPQGEARYKLTFIDFDFCQVPAPGPHDLELYVVDRPFSNNDGVGRQTNPPTDHKVSAFWRLDCQ